MRPAMPSWPRCCPNCDAVHEISIIPRGRAAGYTMTLPEKESQHMTRGKLNDTIAMMLLRTRG